MAAQYPTAIATDADLLVASNRVQTTLALDLNSSDTTCHLTTGANFPTNSTFSIGSEICLITSGGGTNTPTIQRGYDGTVAASHPYNSLVSAYEVAHHHNQLAAEVKAIEAALGPNLENIGSGVTSFKGRSGTVVPAAGDYRASDITYMPFLAAADYDFPAVSPGGSLPAGAAAIIFPVVPRGVNGNNTNHYLWIANGAGSAEAAKIIGGSGRAGDVNGQIIVQCAGIHSGAWTVKSATGGIQEAIWACAYRGCVRISSSFYVYAPIYTCLPTNRDISIEGDGLTSTWVTRHPSFASGDIFFHEQNTGIGQASGLHLRNFSIYNAGEPGSFFNNSGGSAIRIKDQTTTPVLIENVAIHDGYRAVNLENATKVTLTGVIILQNSTYAATYSATEGILINGGGDIQISDCFVYPDTDDPAHQLSYGLHVLAVDGLQVSNSFFKGKYNIALDNQVGNIANVQLSNCTLDRSAGGSGITLTGTAGAFLNITFENLFIHSYADGGKTPGDYGIRVNAINLWDLSILNCTITGWRRTGISLAAPSLLTRAYVTIANNKIFDNGYAGTGLTGEGINISAGFIGAKIIENTISNRNQFGNNDQKIGIETAGNATDVIIEQNDLVGNTLSPVAIGAGVWTRFVVRNNSGYNPAGPFAITVLASPFTYTAGVSPEVIYFKGGTVSSIARSGVTLATASPAVVQLPPNGSLVVTYSVAPTMVRDVL